MSATVALGAAKLGVDVIGSIFGGSSQRKAAKDNNRALQKRGEFAADFLRQDNISNRFDALQGLFAGDFNQISNEFALSGLASSRAAQANLSRAGLGSTGLGSTLSAGLTAGATFQANSLRTKLRQELLNQAISTQAQQGNLFAGAVGNPAPLPSGNVFTDTLNGIGIAAKSGALDQLFGKKE